MREFESFVYLDVPKTGSTFICTLLRKFGTEKEILKRPHFAVGDSYNSNKFHFISVRNPLDQFVSLYSYGSEKKGALYGRFKENGHDQLYDGSWSGFESWLDFVLDPENAWFLDNSYSVAGQGEGCKKIGFQSYRFLNLAVPHVKELLDLSSTKDQIIQMYNSQKIATFTIRYESFRSDLEQLLRTRLRTSIADLTEALRFLETSPPINASQRIEAWRGGSKIGRRRRKRLQEREWLLHELFGY